MSEQELRHVQEVKRRYENDLMRKANVVGVGIGFRSRSGRLTSELCIVVSVKTKTEPAKLKREDVIPAVIENVPIDVIATGEIHAL